MSMVKSYLGAAIKKIVIECIEYYFGPRLTRRGICSGHIRLTFLQPQRQTFNDYFLGNVLFTL
jgi:hypothetical protein